MKVIICFLLNFTFIIDVYKRQALYHTHPVKIDIAGTVESISHITPELLYQCYHTFYDLHNMALCVAGNIDKETVLKLVDQYCKPAQPFAVDRVFEEEPRSIVKNKVTQALSVATPLFQFGFKEEAGKNRRTVKELDVYKRQNFLFSIFHMR